MVYYYSGTGNSAYVARELARMTGQKRPPRSIPEVMKGSRLDIYLDKVLGFVFPIYSWGVPPMVLKFVKRLPAALFEGRYVWAVCTCGDEAGLAMRNFSKAIKEVCARQPDLCASVIMPNNYVLLPGFNVDSEEVRDSKLAAAPRRLRQLADLITARTTEVYDVHEGSMPALRSLVYPLFKRWGINPGHWKVSGKCVGCGKCASICPAGNISINSQCRPEWGDRCLSCCACFHVCPERAIDYGKMTQGKGQYLFPGYPFRK